MDLGLNNPYASSFGSSFLDALNQALSNVHPDASSLNQTPSAPAPPTAPQVDPNQIVVTAGQNQGYQPSAPVNYPDAPSSPPLSNGPDAPDFGNRSIVEAARAAVANDRQPKSHLHSMLNNLQDAVLNAWGKPRIHKEDQDETDAQNAQAGFTINPYAAIERLNTVNSTAASKLYNDYQTQQARMAEVKSLDANRVSQETGRRQTQLKGLQDYAARIIHGAGNDDAKFMAAVNQVDRFARANGFTLDDVGISPNMTPVEREVYGNGDMTVNNQNMLPIHQQTADAATENAAAHMKNANRPHPGPQPKPPTNVMTYTGDDGYMHTVRSDGTVVTSPGKVLPKKGSGRRSLTAPSSSGWGPVTRQ